VSTAPARPASWTTVETTAPLDPLRLAAELLFRRARPRLAGVNGDVMGAMGEIATTATLLAAAVLWS
jgi:cobalamin synthase